MKKLITPLLLIVLILALGSCSKPAPAKILTIKKIVVNSWPVTDANGVTGQNWDPDHSSLNPGDPNGDPDIFPEITSDVSTTVWKLADYRVSAYTDAAIGDDPSFTVETVLQHDAVYNIRVWDYDQIDPNDLMASVLFKPSDYDIGTSETAIQVTSGRVSVTVYATYK